MTTVPSDGALLWQQHSRLAAVAPAASRKAVNVINTSVGWVTTDENGSLTLVDMPRPCHGYRNCCQCDACLLREQPPLAAPPEPKQPWDIAA